jgi:hypothetical protein
VIPGEHDGLRAGDEQLEERDLAREHGERYEEYRVDDVSRLKY